MKRHSTAIIVYTICTMVLCDHVEDLTLPRNFRFGAGSSAYQTEGAWNVSGRGQSVWDLFTHRNPELIKDRSNGDVACDGYHKYLEDVQLIKDIGLDSYAFTISWPRVLPNGLKNNVSKDGLQYYINLTKELVKNGIEPIVTLNDWDHPQAIENQGGWLNDSIITWFADYAEIMFRALGDSVKKWITLNEPFSLCTSDYPNGVLTRLENLTAYTTYMCVHNKIKAHAKVYRMYDELFRKSQQGQVGFAVSVSALEPKNPGDTESVEIEFQFEAGLVAGPFYHGDYPDVIKRRVGLRLPKFSQDWKQIIKGATDFFGINILQARLVEPDPDEKHGIYNSDSGIKKSCHPSWASAVDPWTCIYPPGLSRLLLKIKEKYNNPNVYIMKNGFPDAGGLDDSDRVIHSYEYMKQVLIAINQYGCNVKVYIIWSLMDQFEWMLGYTKKFGLYHVKFTDPDRARTPKKSMKWWRKVMSERKLQPPTANY